MKKYFYLYKFNLLNILFNRRLLINIGLIILFNLIMGIVFVISANNKIPNDNTTEENSLNYLFTIKKWYYFINVFMLMILTIQLGLFLGKSDIEKELTKMELRSGFKFYEVFIFKQVTFMSLLILLFVPIILINLILYFSFQNFVTHYYFYQFFLVSILWFFLFTFLMYSIFYVSFLFFKKVIFTSIFSIVLTVIMFLNVIESDELAVLFNQVIENDNQNLASYQYNVFKKSIESQNDLDTFLKKVISESQYNFENEDVHKVLIYLCNDKTDAVAKKYNNIFEGDVKNYSIRIGLSTNQPTWTSYFDKLLAKIKNEKDGVIKSFLNISRLNQHKTLDNGGGLDSIIPYHNINCFSENDFLNYSSLQMAFWSTALLVINGSMFSDQNKIIYTTGINEELKTHFYKNQTLEYLLNPIFQFNIMMTGTYFKMDPNYIYLNKDVDSGFCLNYKFVFGSDNIVKDIKQIVNVYWIYSEYAFVSVLLILLSYFRYKKLLNK